MREVGNAERQGDYARAIELTAEVLAEDVSSQGEASEDALRSRMLLARLLDAAGRWEESEERFEEVGRLLGPPAADERSNLRISWMLTRGELAEARDDVEEATHWYGRIAENCPGWPPDPDAGFCARLGWLRRWRMYADRGLAERALPLTDKAWVEVHPDPLAPERPEFIAAAEAYHRFGAYPEAIAWTEASEDVWKKRRALGDDNEVFIRSGFLRGVGISIGRFYQFAPMGTEARIEALVRLGRQDEARRLETRDLAYWSRPDRFEEILTANIEHHGERPESAQDYSYAYEARGYYRWKKRRFADALADYVLARRLFEQEHRPASAEKLEGRHVDAYLRILPTLAAIQVERGDYRAARDALETMKDFAAKWRHPADREGLDAEAALAGLLEKERRDADAREAWRALLERTREIRGAGHADTAWTAARAAAVERRLGNAGEAARLEELAAETWRHSDTALDAARARVRTHLAEGG